MCVTIFCRKTICLKKKSIHTWNSSSDRIVVSMSKLKSSSFKLALAVSRSKNVSNGENFSSSLGRPEIYFSHIIIIQIFILRF